MCINPKHKYVKIALVGHIQDSHKLLTDQFQSVNACAHILMNFIPTCHIYGIATLPASCL